jgi:hypothetical protein
MPFDIYLLFSIVWNLVLNIKFNKWWAGGNVYLILNTVFNLSQAFNAIWLVFEFPVYLQWFKVARFFSLVAAVLYNSVYAYFAYALYSSIYEYDYETMGAPSVFETFKDMYMIYNLVLHIPIIPLNMMIIGKEIEI